MTTATDAPITAERYNAAMIITAAQHALYAVVPQINGNADWELISDTAREYRETLRTPEFSGNGVDEDDKLGEALTYVDSIYCIAMAQLRLPKEDRIHDDDALAACLRQVGYLMSDCGWPRA